MTILYFDCFSGASGDMILGALLDAGAPEAGVRDALARLSIGGWELHVHEVSRAGLRAARAEVVVNSDGTARTHADVVDIIADADLPESVARRAETCFGLLAVAEGRIHGVPPQDVHFHEVGAVDAIVDVVACCAALEHWRPERVVTSPIATGTGAVASAHGTLPLPAPAVTEILRGRGAALFGSGRTELVTPTGAALLATFTDEFGELPAMTVEATGYGAGRHDLDAPNVVRVLAGSATAEGGGRRSAVLVECNVDDMSPELVPHVVDSLLTSGAQDAWATPIVMKKGRPALQLSVLADEASLEPLVDVVYRETTTLGLRITRMHKDELSRRWTTVDVAGARVRMKLALRNGEVTTIAPEHDDALAAARATGLPLKTVYARALRAVDEAG